MAYNVKGTFELTIEIPAEIKAALNGKKEPAIKEALQSAVEKALNAKVPGTSAVKIEEVVKAENVLKEVVRSSVPRQTPGSKVRLAIVNANVKLRQGSNIEKVAQLVKLGYTDYQSITSEMQKLTPTWPHNLTQTYAFQLEKKGFLKREGLEHRKPYSDRKPRPKQQETAQQAA